jgi:hypothetical protein
MRFPDVSSTTVNRGLRPMSDDNAKPSGPVGYGKPPQNTRFKKGVSGNPKGRPKGSLNVASVFMKTLREKVVLNENGQRKKVSKLEAAIKQLVNKAATGDQRSMHLLVDLARDAESKQNIAVNQQQVISAADQEVIDDILKRFSDSQEEVIEPLEDSDGDLDSQ